METTGIGQTTILNEQAAKANSPGGATGQVATANGQTRGATGQVATANGQTRDATGQVATANGHEDALEARKLQEPEELHWYALKVFYRRFGKIREDFAKKGYRTFFPIIVEEHVVKGKVNYDETPAVSSLLFVRCPMQFLKDYKSNYDSNFLVYPEPGTNKPAPIDDREMEFFMMANSVSSPAVKYVEHDEPRFHEGMRVRVTDGVFKGLEGYVVRYDREKRLMVSITGIAVVMVSHIHPKYLEAVEPQEVAPDSTKSHK